MKQVRYAATHEFARRIADNRPNDLFLSFEA
jgi:hypothetical protein